MGRGSKKTFTNKILGMVRRLWSFPKVRIGTSIFIILTLIYLFYQVLSNSNINTSNRISTSNEALTYSNYKPQTKSNHRIACLIIGDSYIIDHPRLQEQYLYAISGLLTMLQIYDKYLSPFCDVKAFIVNNSKTVFPYTSEELQITLPSTQVSFIPRNKEKFGAKKWRLYTYCMISYAYKYYQKYEWYLKLSNVDKLVMVDHFQQLVYNSDGQSLYNMDEPQLIGHAIKDTCADFIYGDAVYAFNQNFLQTVGIIASEHTHTAGKHSIRIDFFQNCKSHGACNRHAQDDFVGFCLTDLGVNIEPTRDDKHREYFLIHNIRDHYVNMDKYKKDDWYWFGKSKKAVGKNCCADYPVAFSNYPDSDLLEHVYETIYSVTPKERDMKFLSTVSYFAN